MKIPWTVTFHDAARNEIADLPLDLQTRLERLFALVEESGFDRLPPKATKHLDDDLWEFRVKGRDGIGRAIYVTRTGRRLVVVLVFAKKTQKTPPRAIRLARRRAEEM